MSTITQTTNSGGDDSTGDSDTIAFTVYYDENGNSVNENGYLLDEDGNLVVSADSELTAAYTVEAADGTIYTVGEDATLTNNMLKSTVDTSQDSLTVDTYGNEVSSEGYLIDQSDSEGGYLILDSASDLAIEQQDVVEVTASDGSVYTYIDDDTATFSDTGTTSNYVYVKSGVSETQYYDENGSRVTAGTDTAVLADSDGNALTVTSESVEDGSYYYDGTYYYGISDTGSSASYYIEAYGSATQLYVDDVQVATTDLVYYDGTYYYVADGSTAVSASGGSTAGVDTYVVSSTTTTYDSGDTVVLGASSSSYYLYSYTLTSTTTPSSTYYAIGGSSGVSSASKGWYTATSGTYAGASATYYYYDGSNWYTASLTKLDNQYIGTTAVSSASDGYFYNTAELLYDGTNYYEVTSSGTGLYTDSNTTTAASVTLDSSTLYYGYGVAQDSAGNLVTLGSTSGTEYYLSDTTTVDGTAFLTVSATDSTIVTAYTYTQNGTDYITQETTTDADGNTLYTNFVAGYDSSATLYYDANGLAVDSSGYLIDSEGERSIYVYETLYVYTQSVDYTDENGDTATSYYYYYFGSTAASDYVYDDTLVNSEDASEGYYVSTGVMTTLYYDVYGNTLNAAGYIVDATTGNVVSFASDAEIKAGYSFTSLNGVTYVVSGSATIDATTGIVYSGVYDTRYYGDDGSVAETLDSKDTEYTSDALWIIIRNDEDVITHYQSVSDGTKYTAADWEAAGYATASSTGVTA